MSEHWNIQINIQRVKEPQTASVLSGKQTERSVISVLDLKISAESEAAAYAKAYKMLMASGPDLSTLKQQWKQFADAVNSVSAPPVKVAMGGPEMTLGEALGRGNTAESTPVGISRPIRDNPQA